MYGRVEDDHVPFLKRGVKVLHVIPLPFPEVWHTKKDNAAALHAPTIRSWAIIMSVFVREMLHL
jgi:glutaminyl-peptide cyclotransferase